MPGYEERLKTLRYRLLDAGRAVTRPEMRDCAAHLLVYLDRPGEVRRIALRHLLFRLAAQQADIVLGSPLDESCTIAAIEFESGDAAPEAGLRCVSNRHPAVQIVWKANSSVYIDARHDPILGSLRADLLRCGTRAKLARRLSEGSRIFGMVCVDSFETRDDWNRDGGLYLDIFVREVLAPILSDSLALASERSSTSLTKAEISVARLVASGMTYKQVGRELGKSPSTVDNQLSSIRAKLGVSNRVELARVCSTWL